MNFTLFKIPSFVKSHLNNFASDYSIPQEKLNLLQKNLNNLNYTSPLVSVIVIAYNEQDKIVNCISSLLSQETEFEYEVIVVNNNSKDKTQYLLNQIGVKSFFENKQGHGFARQCGTDNAKGKYHVTADADTIYHPKHVQTIVQHMIEQNATGVFGRYSFIDDGKMSRFTLAFYEFFRDIIVNLRAVKRPELCVGGASFAYLAEEARKVGWRTDIKRGEDGNMASKMKRCGKLYFSKSFETRIWSSARRLEAEGSFFKMVFSRFAKDVKRIHEFFVPQKGLYKDRKSNLKKDIKQ
jgi:glycosyltransferase involved in cell wall biosynthesis